MIIKPFFDKLTLSIKEFKKNIFLFLIKNKFILKRLLSVDGGILEYASDRLKDNFNIVLTAVKQDGFALQYASERLRGDKIIVLEALKQGNNSTFAYANYLSNIEQIIDFASDRLKDDKEFMLEVLELIPYSAKYISDNLKGDKEVVIAFIKKDHRLLQFAENKLKDDINFCIECAKINEGCVSYFEGNAKSLFAQFDNNVEKVEQHLFIICQQEKELQEQNKNLLLKIEKSLVKNPTELFKRKLF
jgi:hypothetical protein